MLLPRCCPFQAALFNQMYALSISLTDVGVLKRGARASVVVSIYGEVFAALMRSSARRLIAAQQHAKPQRTTLPSFALLLATGRNSCSTGCRSIQDLRVDWCFGLQINGCALHAPWVAAPGRW